MGCVGPWLGGLRGLNFYLGGVGYVGQNVFYVGQHFTWVTTFTWVAWVQCVFAWVNFFYMCQNFLRELKLFAWV